MDTPVKIEDAIKTETAVIEEVNESVKVNYFVSLHPNFIQILEASNDCCYSRFGYTNRESKNASEIYSIEAK